MGERQSCLAGLQVYLHPASRRFGRGGAAFRAGSHTSTWLSVGLRFLGSKLHVCEKEEKPQLTPPRQHTSGSPTARLAWRLGFPLSSQYVLAAVSQTMPEWLGTRERQSIMALAVEETGVPGVQISSRSSKMITEMDRKKATFPSSFSTPLVQGKSTACKRGSLLLRRLTQDKGQS